MRFPPTVRLALTLLALVSACQPKPATATSVPTGFAADIQAFADWDARNATPVDPIVFAGSSSIRLWNTSERFPDKPIVNRGFGGSQLSDVNTYIKETVLGYQPRIVVLYAGDNDINAGKTNDQVFAAYETFVAAVHGADSTTEIIFISIKPSLQRWALWPQMRELNARVRAHAQQHLHQHYIDLATPLLGPDGMPRPELFREDGLHMTSAGYDIWSSRLQILLDSVDVWQRRPDKRVAVTR